MLQKISILLSLITCFCFGPYLEAKEEFITGYFVGQLGNQMFFVATVSAHAWDNGVTAYFPQFGRKKEDGVPHNFKNVFFRCKAKPPYKKSSKVYDLPYEHYFTYTSLPYWPYMVINHGAYQNEKYFAHHKEEILQLFAPDEKDLNP